MRSSREILFRLRQEAANIWLLLRAPAWEAPESTFPQSGLLPDPEQSAAAAAGSGFATEVVGVAEDALRHRFHLLGLDPVEFGPAIPWRRDWVHGKETGTEYFRRIPYLDFQAAGDHKIIWELNRHQHLVAMAQAFLLTGRREFLGEIGRQIEDWMDANPFQRGINWTSALEVAFRAMSWLWVLHLIGGQLEASLRRRWLSALYQHGLHLEYNLSVYFSPNTHLLGEAVVLHALGRLLPAMPRAGRWRSLARDIVLQQMERQVRPDGSHYEQSTYYHLYAVDFFFLFALLEAETPDWFKEKLERMAEYLDALVSREGILPLIGDEDGGRLFHPYGDRRRFAQATLASCALRFDQPQWCRDPEARREQAVWWIDPATYQSMTAAGPPPTVSASVASRRFADSGTVVMQSPVARVIVAAGGFASGSAGHSHADALSITAFYEGREVLIDPGTCTYVSDPELRQRYRGTAAHNTVSIDYIEQAIPRGPFRWEQPPEVEILRWEPGDAEDVLDLRCRYRGWTHHRLVRFQKPDVLLVLDHVVPDHVTQEQAGNSADHTIEQRWLIPSDAVLSIAGDPELRQTPAERSRAFGSSEAAVRWVGRHQGAPPATLVTVMHLDGAPVGELRVYRREQQTVVEYAGREVCFPSQSLA